MQIVDFRLQIAGYGNACPIRIAVACVLGLVACLGVAAGAAAPTALDRFGEPLPEGAVQRLGSQRMRYRGIGDLCYLPDGRSVIAIGRDADVWEAGTGKLQGRYRVSEGSIISLEPRKDGQVLLIGDSAGKVLEWEIASGKALRQWATGQAGLRAAHYSPDETRALTTGSTPPTLKEWALATGKELAAVNGKMHFFNEGIYGPDGKTAFVDGSAGSGPVLAQYDLATGALLKEWLKDYYTHGRSMLLSPDGQRLLVGSRHKATEWQVEGLGLLKEFTGHHGHAVTSVAYCANPEELLTGSRDGSIRRWNRLTGKVLLRWVPHAGHVTHLRVSPDGKWVLSYGGGTVAETSVADGSARVAIDRHEQGVQGVAPLPDGRAASASADGTLRVWSLGTGECATTIPGATLGAYCVAASPDGSRIAAGCKDGVIREFTVADGRLAREMKGHRGYIRSVAYAPDGRLLSSADDGSIRVWGAGAAEPEQTLQGHRGGVLSLALSPDGTLLLSGGRDATVRLWALKKPALLQTWEGHRGWVEAVLFSADGRSALSAGRDGRILKRDAGTGKVLAEMAPGARVLSLAVAGATLCAGGEDGKVTLWDVATGKQAGALPGHAGTIHALAATRDGKRLVTASEDTTLLVWRLP